MVFKRREKRPFGQPLMALLWPRKGWLRPFYYVKHRLTRLPDSPHRIARGIFAGVCVTFSPFFGLHFLLAAVLAWIMRGNILAALLATFVGNPFTFPVIAALSLRCGHTILGQPPIEEMDEGKFRLFLDSLSSLYRNITSLFTGTPADWHHVYAFYLDVFQPYMVGGVFTGLLFGWLGYYLSLPMVKAYQKRRKSKLKAKWLEIKEKAAIKTDAAIKADDEDEKD